MTYPDQKQYLESIRSAEDNFDKLSELRPVPGLRGEPYMSSGNYSVVFKMTDGAKEYAVKCFTREQAGRAEAYTKIMHCLAAVKSPYIVDMEYLDEELFVDVNGGTNYPVLKMEWVDGMPLNRYVKQNKDDRRCLRLLADTFCDMARWLLRQPIAHGDLKPDNILVRRDGTLVLVDYDGMFVPSMTGEKWRETGTPPYSHRLRQQMPFDAYADDYAITLIALMLRAAEVCGADYDALETAARKGIKALTERLASADIIADARLCALLAAYHKVDTCGIIDGSLAGMLLSFGDDVETRRRLLAGNDESVPQPTSAPTASRQVAKDKGTIAGHEYVDLGLSVKWATCNVGANSPEDYGDYYAWGETSIKSSYDEDNCETWEKSIGDIKGTSRDVAHVKWGGSWRMPTEAEFGELFDPENYTWTWTTQGGHKGYKVTSRKNGNSIFLPAAGWRGGSSLGGQEDGGGYWISTPNGGGTLYARGLFFDSSNYYTYWGSRYHGHTVRPVAE